MRNWREGGEATLLSKNLVFKGSKPRRQNRKLHSQDNEKKRLRGPYREKTVMRVQRGLLTVGEARREEGRTSLGGLGSL